MSKSLIITRNLSFHKLKTFYSNLFKSAPPTPPYNHIVQLGDPTLRLKSEEVPIDSITKPETQLVVNKLKHTLHKYQCYGLAAPQIGVAKRIFVFKVNKESLHQINYLEVEEMKINLRDLIVVINPVIKITDNQQIIEPENCESVKGYYGDVARSYALDLSGFNEDGGQFKISAKGWISRIIQHEMDHLEGNIYTDIMDRKSFTSGCWKIVNDHRGKVNLHFHSA